MEFMRELVKLGLKGDKLRKFVEQKEKEQREKRGGN